MLLGALPEDNIVVEVKQDASETSPGNDDDDDNNDMTGNNERTISEVFAVGGDNIEEQSVAEERANDVEERIVEEPAVSETIEDGNSRLEGTKDIVCSYDGADRRRAVGDEAPISPHDIDSVEASTDSISAEPSGHGGKLCAE